jgi:hypothetical protein
VTGFSRLLLATGVFLLSACANDPQINGAPTGASGGAATGQSPGGSAGATIGGAAIGGGAGGLDGRQRNGDRAVRIDGEAPRPHPCQPIFNELAQDPVYLAYPADIQAEISGDRCLAHLEGY